MNVVGFDDGPFDRAHRGSILLVGAVCAGTRLDGVLSGSVRRDGVDSTARMIQLIEQSQFRNHVQAVLLQGIAVGGFNVVDIHTLSATLAVPVLVVARREPDLLAVQRALFTDVARQRPRIGGARRKWRLIEAAGAMDRLELSRHTAHGDAPTGMSRHAPQLYVQRAGLSLSQALQLLRATTLHGHVPEPLRLAHLIAGGIVTGKSRGRV